MPEERLHTAVRDYLADFSRVISALNPDDINLAVNLINSTRGRGVVYTCGNGGSASTAEHFASDLCKWANLGHAQNGSRDSWLRAICLNANMPQISALTNDAGWPNIYTEVLKVHRLSREDVLVAFSVHGGAGEDKAGPYSQNLNNAIRYALSVGAKTIGLSGFDGGAFRGLCDVCLNVPADSTPIVEGIHGDLSHMMCDMLRK